MFSKKIQNIVFPFFDIDNTTNLYFRFCGQFVLDGNNVLLMPDAVLDTLTYFNAFSVDKWKQYTVLDNVCIEMLFEGTAAISVFTAYGSNGEIIVEELSEQTCCSDGKVPVYIPVSIQKAKGIIGYKIKAITKLQYKGGAYCTENEPIHAVSLAVNICTRNRQEYLLSNVKTLMELNECLENGLQIVISNNGSPIVMDEIERENIHIYSQKGYGSSGGFARGAYEIIRTMADKVTHVIFMDDDVCIEKEAIFRTHAILTYAHSQYYNNILGGALLRLDRTFIQHESGARWNNGYIESIFHDLDLRNVENIVRNETETDSDFFGWWYCCFPLKVLIEKGLSLPLYFHREDVEYGLRNPSNTCMNGICVWHEAFDNKPFSVNKYYDTRNTGVVNTIYNEKRGALAYIKYVISQVKYEIFRYRYIDALLVIKGAEDFCKGPDWMIDNDSDELYERLKKSGYAHTEGIPEKEFTKYEIKEGKMHKVLRILSLNGYLFPASKCIVVPMCHVPQFVFFRAKEVCFYNKRLGLYYNVKRDWIKTVHITFKLICVLCKISVKYNEVSRMWKKNKNEYTSISFWGKYFRERERQ